MKRVRLDNAKTVDGAAGADDAAQADEAAQAVDAAQDEGDIDDGILIIKGGTGPLEHHQVECTPQPKTALTFYLAIHAIKSADNLGSLLRTAGAFGCREVLVVNPEKKVKRLRKSTRTFGAHGAERRVAIRAFVSLDRLITFARRQGCRIVGIEIHPDAVTYSAADAFGNPVRPTCFLPGNEGDGLSSRQIAMCDSLVYVPHFGTATASLNVNAATAIVLSAFAIAAGYTETDRDGAKFSVVDRPFLRSQATEPSL